MKNIRSPCAVQFRSNTGGMYRKPLYTVHRIAVLDADGTRLEPIKNVQSKQNQNESECPDQKIDDGIYR